MSQFTSAYVQFFESPAGLELLTTLATMIDSEHQHAEDNPELARDHTQRAKGMRSVQNIIKSLQIGVKSLSDTTSLKK